ncbi:MAG: hypothetical protein IK012_08280 [Fibrobacter sp.]|uniref:FISUMP domain-containing protein n=1 Tax=Fibrobacter sp. TaxID=35828 RepID=UPI0025BD8F8F|nr:FISUMP domain-containing protein [Fibrobacter sp.]MBR4785233.1 hypothetical protein [Fibrobacter sp.]
MRLGLQFPFVLLAFALLAACSDDYSSQLHWPGEDDLYSSEEDSFSTEVESSSSEKSSSSSAAKSSSSETKTSSSSYFKENWNYLNPEISYGEMTDSRDGQIYKTVVIGTRKWMAENLNFETENSSCFNDSLESCGMYGRLYTWTAAMDTAGVFSTDAIGCGHPKDNPWTVSCEASSNGDYVRGVCPEGWHLPHYEEWRALILAGNNPVVPGKALRSMEGWDDGVGNGTDEFGFSAIPVPVGGHSAEFWTPGIGESGPVSETVMHRVFENDRSSSRKLSVRCVSDDTIAVSSSSGSSSSNCEPNMTLCKTESEDNCEYESLTDDRDGRVYKTVKLGCKWWMAENLAFETEHSFEGKYGRLYEWGALAEACPSGWHVSMVDEWYGLNSRVGREFGNLSVLKSTTGWKVDSSRVDDEEWDGNGNGTDGLGFSVFPDGYVYAGERSARHYKVGENASFWMVDYFQSDVNVEVFYVYGVDETYTSDPYAFSVRCVKD